MKKQTTVRKPIPEEKWEEVEAYCVNDVVATEAVARLILSDISGLTPIKKKAAPIAITYNRKLKKMQYDNVTVLTSYVRPEIMAVILKALPSKIVRTKVYSVSIVMPTSG